MYLGSLTDGMDIDSWLAFTPALNTVTIDYNPNSVSTLQAGQEDRFYLGGAWMDSSNFLDEGILVGLNTNSGATTITIGGGSYPDIPKGQGWYVFGARFTTATGQPTGLYSNSNKSSIVHTTIDEFPVVKAYEVQEMNPATDNFWEWFITNQDPCPWIKAERKYDQVEGRHYFSVSTFDIIDQAGFASIDICGTASKIVSPHHDWSIEISFRHNGKGASSNASQFEFGITAGNMRNIMYEFYRRHPTHGQLNNEISLDDTPWPASYAPVSQFVPENNAPAWTFCGHWATISRQAVPEGTFLPIQNWLQIPNDTYTGLTINNPGGGTIFCAGASYWNWPLNTIRTCRFDYDSTNKCVRQYIDGTLIAIFAAGISNEAVPALRKLIDAEGFFLPISYEFILQYLYPNETYLDIFSLKITTQCPNDYSGCAFGGNHRSYSWMPLPSYYGLRYWDRDSTPDFIDDLVIYYPGLTSNTRFDVQSWTGMIKRPITPADWPEGWPVFNEETWNFEETTAPGYTTAYEEFRAMPINVPTGGEALKVMFNSDAQHGTMTARLLDQSLNQLLTYQSVTAINGQSFTAIGSNFATKVYPSYKMNWVQPTPFYTDETPPKISGFSLELTPPPRVVADKDAGGYPEGTKVYLLPYTGSDATAVEYGWGASPPGTPIEYTDFPTALELTIQEDTLWWRGTSDSGATVEAWQSAEFFFSSALKDWDLEGTVLQDEYGYEPVLKDEYGNLLL